MDTITHCLAGAVIAKTGLNKPVGKWGTIAGVVSALLPDMDWPLYLFFDKIYLLQYHRWILNSVFSIPLFAFILAYIFVRITKITRFWVFFWICFFVLLSHLIFDLITSYGTMILSPFSNKRFAFDLVFIVDLLFSTILLAPLILSYFWKRHANLICGVSLVLLTLYIGLCGIYHSRAIDLTLTFARQSEIPYKQVASFPQPTSPFKWVSLVETEDVTYQGYLDFLKNPGEDQRIGGNTFWGSFSSKYRSPSEIRYRIFKKMQSSPWIQKALELDEVGIFYEFARFPIARYRKIGSHHFAEFVDLRFSIPGIRNPFRYVVEFSEEGHMIRQGFRSWPYE